MQNNKTHWASLLTLIVLGFGLLFLTAASVGLGINSLINLFSGEGMPTAEMISAVAFFFHVILLFICGWFVLQKTRGIEQADSPVKLPFAWWQAIVAVGIPVIGALIGGGITLFEIEWLSWIFLPLLTVLVIVPPIWLFFGSGSNGLEAGPRWRFFAVFGLSMTIGPAIMIVLELVVLIFGLIFASVYLAVAQPVIFDEITNISQLVMDGMGQEELLSMVTPYIANPAVLAAGIGYIAVIVPLIEELFKPLAVWLFAKKIESPAQGFVLGMLSGAAFGVFESLNASADGTIGWAVIVAARAGTSLLHIATSGLVGWGIVSAFKEKKFGRLAGAFLAAVLIHGVWNAAAAGAGITAIGETIGKPEWLYNYAPAMLCGLLVLGIGIFAVLLASNRKLRSQHLPITPPEEEKVELTS